MERTSTSTELSIKHKLLIKTNNLAEIEIRTMATTIEGDTMVMDDMETALVDMVQEVENPTISYALVKNN